MPRTYPHPPGPWTLEAGRSISTSSGRFYLGYGRDAHGNAEFKSPCELDSIAHLVAAAPDLLAALQSELLRGHVRGCPKHTDADRACNTRCTNARAAILKATQE